jgi:uncharacterized protein (UPF0332 family)
VKQGFKDLAKYRLERARDTLLDAQKYFKDATLNSTVNRIYYAMFYAVNPLLISKGLSSSKHSGVRALFNKEFVSKGTVEKNWGKFYSEMSNNRQERDYTNIPQVRPSTYAFLVSGQKRFCETRHPFYPQDVECSKEAFGKIS